MIVNKKTIAEIFGVTERTVTDWEQAGLPIESRPGRGISNEYDSVKCIDWRCRRIMSGERQLTARERKDEAQARLYELELAQKSEQFVSNEDIAWVLETLITTARDHLLSAPRKWKATIDREFNIESDLSVFQKTVADVLIQLADSEVINRITESVSQETGNKDARQVL